MKRFATTLSSLLALLLLAVPASAQEQCPDGFADVTVRQLNSIPQDNVNQLMALGASATPEQIRELVTNEWINQCVRVQGVIMSDPRYSGLASVSGGIPGRYHIWLRDIAARTDGMEGMTIQIVDGTNSGEVSQLRVGDVVELEARLTVFSGTGANPSRAWQLAPVGGAYDVVDTVPSGDAILQPVVVSTEDIHRVVSTSAGESLVQIDWSNWNSLNGQFVRLENATVTNSAQNETLQRPNWAVSSPATEARVPGYDTSLRFRNDRDGVYPNPPFFTRPADDPFVAPPPGALVDVQGFLTFQAWDPFNFGEPLRAVFNIVPIMDDDFQIAQSPPVISVLSLSEIPTGPFVVTAEVLAASGDPLTEVMLHYSFSSGAEGTVAMAEAAGENRYAGTIPVTEAEEGAFVTYSVSARDAGGLENESSARTTRILPDGITQIAHIQETASGGHGPSPFAGLTAEMDLNVIVMTEPSESGFLSVQDGTGPWSGVFIVPSEELLALVERGMKLRINSAQIEESFGLTRLRLSSGDYAVDGVTTPHPFVTGISTADFTNRDFAARYQGMALRFDDVVVTNPNADGPPSDFGEWLFSSDGTAASAIRADDQSPNVPFGSSMFQAGDQLEFLQGIWTFSFSNYKLWPESLTDISVSGEEGPTARSFQIDGAYPNPMNRQGTVAYTLDQPGHVTVEVYDVLGRRVALLTDELQGIGQHRTSIDAGSLASGLYILRLTMGNEMQSARFIVTR
ncbi:hypothetical protein BH23BAC4_BH23BAC4_00410 [soil metagenome]